MSQHLGAANKPRWCDWPDRWFYTTILQPGLVQYNTSNNWLQFPTHIFVNIAAEWVDDLPHSVDGLKLYKIKCSQREWV